MVPSVLRRSKWSCGDLSVARSSLWCTRRYPESHYARPFPLARSSPILCQKRKFDIVQCCILNGALLAPRDDGDSGGIDDRVMRKDFTQVYSPIEGWQDDVRLRLLAWAQNVVTNHDNVTLLSASSPPLVIFDGKSGILKLVVDYVGNPTPEELRLFRRLLELLPVFIADVPFVLRP